MLFVKSEEWNGIRIRHNFDLKCREAHTSLTHFKYQPDMEATNLIKCQSSTQG